MRALLMAAAAALSLAACGQMGGNSGPALPTPQAGVQAPSVQQRPTGEVRQINITDENRRMVLGNINDLLNQSAEHFAPGFIAVQGVADQTPAVQPGADYRMQVNLAANTEYRILGVCDADCSNADIELIDSRGGVVASDMLPDDYPVVNYTPSAAGTYYVRYLMQSCTQAPCYAGVRVLQAPASGGGGK
jgi:hypothetical protein